MILFQGSDHSGAEQSDNGKTTGLYALQGFQLPMVGGAKDPVPIAARPSRMKLNNAPIKPPRSSSM
jgi:hypothetical protein